MSEMGIDSNLHRHHSLDRLSHGLITTYDGYATHLRIDILVMSRQRARGKSSRGDGKIQVRGDDGIKILRATSSS